MSSFKKAFVGISALTAVAYIINLARISVASQDPILTIVLNSVAAILTIVLIGMLIRYIVTRRPKATGKIYAVTGIAILVVLLGMSTAYIAAAASMYQTDQEIKNY